MAYTESTSQAADGAAPESSPVLGYYGPTPESPTRAARLKRPWHPLVVAMLGFNLGLWISALLAGAGFVAGDLLDDDGRNLLPILLAGLVVIPAAVIAYVWLGSPSSRLVEAMCVGTLAGSVLTIMLVIAGVALYAGGKL